MNPELGLKPTHDKNKNNIRTKESARAAADPRIETFKAWFGAEYEKAFNRPYVFSHGKDGATLKRLFKTLDTADLQKATAAMLTDDWARERASIGLLGSQVNTLLNPSRTTQKKSYVKLPAPAGKYDAFGD